MANKHEKIDRYCPYCLRQLTRVVKTGFTFCPDSRVCEYEDIPDSEKCEEPLTINQVKSLESLSDLDHALKSLNTTRSYLINLIDHETDELEALIIRVREDRDQKKNTLSERLQYLYQFIY